MSDDSEFTQVPGHWAPPSASLAFELGASNPSTVIPGDGDTPRVVRTTSTQISQTAEIEPPDGGEAEEFTETRMLLRPTWSIPADRQKIRDEVRQRLLQERGYHVQQTMVRMVVGVPPSFRPELVFAWPW